jgi:ketosteroid isomerase-like protein
MRKDVDRFATEWLEAWNAHDVEGVLAHFADDATFTSPFAERVFPDSGGVLHGKDAIREYWSAGLRRIPDLRFELVGVYEGQEVVVINYRNQAGALVNEVLLFEGDLVREGHGTYPTGLDNPTGSTGGVSGPGDSVDSGTP